MKVTLTTPQALALAKALAPAICTDKMKIHLRTVDLLVTDTAVVFTAQTATACTVSLSRNYLNNAAKVTPISRAVN